MSAKFYTLLTDIGAAKLTSATALGVPLKITQMAVGDGGGVLPTPNAQQTKLVGEKRRAALNQLYADPQNSSQIIAEQVIPETEGGWWIREVGLFDDTGALIAVGNCPESYKPVLTEGSGRTQTVRMVLITSSTDNITLKIDPAVVLATRQYADEKLTEAKTYAAGLLNSPTLTGAPKTPTPAAGDSSKTIANTEFVKNAIAGIVDSAPAALDTLIELAAALGNDPNFSTTVINALAGKQPLNSTLTNLSGKDVAGILTYLGLGGLGSGSALPVGVPVPWPTATPPTGWIKCNGASFSASTYPQLAEIFPALVLPDLRGEFIRGWDDGRGIDAGRVLLSDQLGTFVSVDINYADSGLVGAIGTIGSDGGLANVNGDVINTPLTKTAFQYAQVAGLAVSTSLATNTVATRPRNIAFNYILRAL